MLSSTSKYGIRAVVYIAGNTLQGKYLGIKKISEDLKLPMPFLAKTLQQLAKMGILSSSKGPLGGFTLARNPEDIHIIDVVKAIEGDDVFHRCILHNANCIAIEKSGTPCILHAEYVKYRYEIEKLFEDKTVQNLVNTAHNSDTLY
ncbi:MAG: Rrf2 family transcriptional regulator [Bacteroidales bacterium]|nr:Rrf2 family transcriptional regulator [Bacteroidales bacterium]